MATQQGREAVHRVVVERDVPMRTRDGITLYADVYRPGVAGRFPVLVVRTPYDKSQEMALTEKDYFPQRGYVVVVQDTRGRFSSEGEFYPFVHEALDGYDTIQWASGLPWSNGTVGMVGQSYLALVQYLVAPLRPPQLKAMSPASGPVSYFQNCVWRRGVLELAWMLIYFSFMMRNTLERKGLWEKWRATLNGYLAHPELPISPLKDELYSHLPLQDWGKRFKDGAPYFEDILRHWTDDQYWQEIDIRSRLAEVDVPILH